MPRLARSTLWLAFLAALLACFSPSRTVDAAPKDRGDVYLLRGGLGGVFSKGLDQMGRQLGKQGVKAQVLPHSRWKQVVRDIVGNRKKLGRRPVVLIGHSLGANNALKIANALKRRRITVDYMVTFAATNTIGVPSNVRRVTNYYFKTDGWGVPLRPGPGFKGRLQNIDFSNDKSVGHFNIDEQPKLQRRVINNTKRYLRFRGS